MSKMRIEAHPALEAYIDESGNICLKQENLDGEDTEIIIPFEHVTKLINWLQILHEERKNQEKGSDAVDG